MRTVWRREGEALAELEVGAADGYRVHPASLDACSRILAAAMPAEVLDGTGRTMYVPAGMQACDIHGPLAGVLWSHATVTARSNGGAPSFTGDVRIYDEQGRGLAEIHGLRLEPLDRPRDSTPTTGAHRLLYERTWQPAPHRPRSTPRPMSAADGSWLVTAAGLEPSWSGRSPSGAARSSTSSRPARFGVSSISAVSMPCRTRTRTPRQIERHVERAVRGVLEVSSARASTPVWIVTRGAMPVSVGAPAVNVAQAPLWGLGRVLAVERPGALGALVDLDPAQSSQESARELLDVLAAPAGEDMVAFRSGVQVRASPETDRGPAIEPSAIGFERPTRC